MDKIFKKITAIFATLLIIISLCSCDFSHRDDKIDQTEAVTEIPTVKVTIPEGYTLVRISWLLEEKGLCTSTDFIDACQTYKDWLDLTKYPFLRDLQNAENVCFYLEGYFFPLTYDIPETTGAKEIVEILLDGTNAVFDSEFLASIQGNKFNLHQLLTLASIVEKEAFLPEQRLMIASVLHNRLNSKMRIQCDPTVKYCTGVIEEIYPDKASEYTPYYDTFVCKGLMAGPICNPGMDSINAVINPAQTEYLYFIIGTVPPYEAKYSVTFEEHLKFWKENKDRLTGEE